MFLKVTEVSWSVSELTIYYSIVSLIPGVYSLLKLHQVLINKNKLMCRSGIAYREELCRWRRDFSGTSGVARWQRATVPRASRREHQIDCPTNFFLSPLPQLHNLSIDGLVKVTHLTKIVELFCLSGFIASWGSHQYIWPVNTLTTPLSGIM